MLCILILNHFIKKIVFVINIFQVFAKTSMKDLVAKSRLLTGYLELLVNRKYKKPIASETITASGDSGCIYVEILTPSDPKQRGAQLSLAFSIDLHIVIAELSKRGVVVSQFSLHPIRTIPSTQR